MLWLWQRERTADSGSGSTAAETAAVTACERCFPVRCTLCKYRSGISYRGALVVGSAVAVPNPASYPGCPYPGCHTGARSRQVARSQHPTHTARTGPGEPCGIQQRCFVRNGRRSRPTLRFAAPHPELQQPVNWGGGLFQLVRYLCAPLRNWLFTPELQ